MKTTVYDFNDYKKYLLEIEASKALVAKGFRSKLAAALNCQPAFITLVLNGTHDLSVEQAFTANNFLQHNEDESNFFLLLVQFARAGVRGLSQHYKKQMDQIREERKRLNARLKIDNKLSDEERALYYSSWHYTALHVILTCPQWRTREAISERLQLSVDRTEQLLNDLVRMGLAHKEGPSYLPSTTRLHLDEAPI